jgi:adenine-specific DNA-methyltransferase
MINDVKDKLDKLVFDFQLANYKSMNEYQTRTSFIDPFWEIMGWQIRNQTEVQMERTDKESKRPDYRFIKKNKVLFFVEAKKPAEDLKNPKHIYQTKLYCWNGNVPLAILTDFEEFRPFRAIGKPNIDDANKGLIKQFDMTFEQYPDQAYDLLNTFGREAVLGGSLNDLIKPTQIELRDTVDKHFLNTLSKWRTDLATQIAKTNKFKNEFDLSEAVQRILDRLVFLRILQDREIENEDFMCLISKNKNLEPYQAFLKICKELAPKYNGLIFNPHPLSENLKIEGSLFKKIVKELDFEDSPYRFDEIPVEMLGTTYERFLGDEISLDKKGKVVIDQKPEVRKAGGVYYTPQYIVEYIVQNTVGKLLETCKTPAGVAKLKILDPACGSGSFLLGAFDALINWHEIYFSNNIPKCIETIGKQSYTLAYIDDSDKVKLTARMKGRILQNNLYGVDLDKQATEVAQMSLYIKVLEGMSNETLIALGFQDAILPKLENNIKCGNSLIGSDFVSDDFFGLSEREKHKINPFDWVENFPFIKETCGFDAVIGNPPYGYMISKKEQDYFSQKYKYQDYQKDLYLLFLERYKLFLKSNALLGIIISNTWLQSVTYESIRKFLVNNYTWKKFLLLPEKVFQAVVDTHVLIFENQKFVNNQNQVEIEIKNGDAIVFSHILLQSDLEINGKPININVSDFQRKLYYKIIEGSTKVINYFKVFNGVKPFEKGKGKPPQTEETMIEKPFVKQGEKPDETWSPLLRGSLIQKYDNLWNNDSWILYGDWLAAPRDPKIFSEEQKIMVRQTGDSIIATIIGKGFIARNNLHILINKNNELSTLYFLGFLNSKLIDFIYSFVNPEKGEALAEVKKYHVEQLPIKNINISIPFEKAQHDKMVELVERMLKLHKDRQSATEFDRKHIDQYIARTDKEIDELVYKLYDLTEEEIKVVEG